LIVSLSIDVQKAGKEMASVNQTQIMSDLSYLLGESTVPTSGTAEFNTRAEFIQRSLERVYRAYNFPMNQVTATFQAVNGVGTLPTNVGQDSIIDIRQVNTGPFTDNVYIQVNYSEHNDFQQNDFRYWLLGYEGNYTFYSSETQTTNVLTVLYTPELPVVNASISTNFPSSMCVAWGAIEYYRLAEDPYTDISPYELGFQRELNEVIAAYNRNRAMKRGITRSEQEGTYTGDITTVGAYVGNVGNE
jgi:hypothetical protein